jgi:tRNA uridine 5-carboxymethylaminomethyl modification enzyme
MTGNYDIIVIGGGHAGCEAARAAALLGSKVLLLTMDMNKFSQMSCNPAIGGIAKGQIVREIDALGGSMGLVTDASTIQFRMLNRSKGPAMWSPRAQCDRLHYSLNWRYILERTPNLDLWQDTADELILKNRKLVGVKSSLGAEFAAKSVIITAGTFLNGRLFIGQNVSEGGRIGELPAKYLSNQLIEQGIEVDRMKTGTPPRLDIRSIDLSKLLKQEGDLFPEKFSFLNIPSPIQSGVAQMNCYIVHTNQKVHEVLREGFEFSPMFTGMISGRGPRYCPSIEDKLKTFSDKTSHQLFLEPEGWNTNEYYLQGFSSSLPLETQYSALREIKGLENVVIYRPAYAVEYDYFPPVQLFHTLESKKIEYLYMAGQVNGTTGYEEAAAQGLMAGINAHLKLRGKEPFVLKRDEAYTGVLIDDLVTKGVDEPYRMFTSRAEYRILLRQDNADLRLTQKSFALGLATEQRMKLTSRKYKLTDSLANFIFSSTVKPDEINQYLDSIGSSRIDSKKKLSEILTRPHTSLIPLLKNVPRGTFLSYIEGAQQNTLEKESIPFLDSINKSLEKLKTYPESDTLNNGMLSIENKEFKELVSKDQSEGGFPYKPQADSEKYSSGIILKEILESVEIRIKYQGYIDREKKLAEKIMRLEEVKIPQNFDFNALKSLSTESRQKLIKHRPANISQASRIPGVSPADISILLVYFGR